MKRAASSHTCDKSLRLTLRHFPRSPSHTRAVQSCDAVISSLPVPINSTLITLWSALNEKRDQDGCKQKTRQDPQWIPPQWWYSLSPSAMPLKHMTAFFFIKVPHSASEVVRNSCSQATIRRDGHSKHHPHATCAQYKTDFIGMRREKRDLLASGPLAHHQCHRVPPGLAHTSHQQCSRLVLFGHHSQSHIGCLAGQSPQHSP